MEIRGVSSTTAVRPTAFQATESGTAGSAPPPTDGTVSTDAAAEKASGAGYISPFLRYDQGARVAVLYFRDFDTGETQDQIPSQRVVEEYRRAAGRLLQEDERKSASVTQTGATVAAATAAGGSTAGTGGTSAGSAAGPAGSGSGSTGISFAGSVGSTGSTGSASGSAASTGTPSSGSGFTPTAAGGGFGGSPGGLVSVTV